MMLFAYEMTKAAALDAAYITGRVIGSFINGLGFGASSQCECKEN